MNPDLIRYEHFILSRLNRSKLSELTELHHIIPRCVGGLDGSANLIALTLREHFLAHLMLWKIYGSKLARAFALMSGRTQGRYDSSRRYELLRTDLRKEQSKLMEGKCKFRELSTGKVLTLEIATVDFSLFEFACRPVGAKFIHNATDQLMVLKEEVSSYLAAGWELGYHPNTVSKMEIKDRKIMHKGEDFLRVKPKEVGNYESLGWSLGWPSSRNQRCAKGSFRSEKTKQLMKSSNVRHFSEATKLKMSLSAKARFSK